MANARSWIKKNGGATAVPLWGKFYLALLGVYEWEGINSLLPELLLLPRSLPIHPSNYWCHARMVYLPMAYCFGEKIKAKPAPLLNELKEELYLGLYEAIDWKAARNKCAEVDLYYPQSGILKVFNKVLNVYECRPLKSLRKKAQKFALDYINAEDEQTNFIDIGPVNQVINTICVWHAYGKDDNRFKQHVERWFDYLWLAEDGMKMNGYNGSQLWDTAFATQAILEGGGEKPFSETIAKANRFIVNAQVRGEVKEHSKYYRHNSVGGWPFSTNEHGWPITDCTAEGLKTALLIRSLNIIKPEEQVPDNMLQQAALLILSFQNANGGWASYELTRGPRWLEALNPSEVFGNIMVDYAYTECTSACVQALLSFRAAFPAFRSKETDQSILKGIDFILLQQQQNGAWYGSWAVCYTYGTWFGVEALAAVLKSDIKVNDRKRIETGLTKAGDFLIGHQQGDGGWGESFQSCIEKRYVHQPSQVVNTAWALLALMALPKPNKAIIERGIKLLEGMQLPSGDFPQQGVSGVFNHNCAISYTSYRNVFPIWALGRYGTMYK
jgi:squalene/oxidosqualene cyclase-like protein